MSASSSGRTEPLPFPVPARGYFRRLPSGALIADNAIVTGDVHLEPEVSVWFNTVIRGDCSQIRIGARTNVQDGTIIHTDTGYDLEIGPDCTIGHMAMIHAERIGAGCLIGIKSVILGHANIGEGCVIAAGAVVKERAEIPAGSLVAGVPARIIREVGEKEREFMKMSIPHYVELASSYLPEGERPTGGSA